MNEIYDPDDVASGTKILIPSKNGKDSKLLTKSQNRSLAGKVASRSNPVSAANFSSSSRAKQQRSTFVWPSPGTISSGFGKRKGRMHQGIDITQDRGRAIIAASAGIVEFSGKFFVSKGMRIKRGAIIAKMGSTGHSTGIHLHFEIRVNGKSSNPLRYLPVR